MKEIYSKPIAEIEKFAMVEVMTASEATTSTEENKVPYED